MFVVVFSFVSFVFCLILFVFVFTSASSFSSSSDQKKINEKQISSIYSLSFSLLQLKPFAFMQACDSKEDFYSVERNRLGKCLTRTAIA